MIYYLSNKAASAACLMFLNSGVRRHSLFSAQLFLRAVFSGIQKKVGLDVYENSDLKKQISD